VSYRSYLLVDRSQRYDPSVTAKLAVFVKRFKHAIEDKFGCEEPIEVLQFLRTFKEAADYIRVSEGAAARLIPYFLKGIAKEGYRTQLGDVPVSMTKYPFMVQYLLETNAVDERRRTRKGLRGRSVRAEDRGRRREDVWTPFTKGRNPRGKRHRPNEPEDYLYLRSSSLCSGRFASSLL
jgi:hypothetical protein